MTTQHIDSAITSRGVTAGAFPLRKIVQRTRGNHDGPITRLMSPGDLGEVLKPFVFLDLFDMEKTSFPGLGLHPHSGIATVTYLFEGEVRYEDTSGASGILTTGGVEWFKAGLGAWHGGGPGDSGRTRGFQLWVALPPDHELAAVESVYQAPDAVKRVGSARVLVGTHGGVASPLNAPVSMNYLGLRLKAGESWSYQPPAGHTVGWIALATGRLLTPESVEASELAIFEPSTGAIDVHAEADTEFVLGSSLPHPYDLVLGTHSVHTSPAALQAAEQRISEIKRRLQSEGRL